MAASLWLACLARRRAGGEAVLRTLGGGTVALQFLWAFVAVTADPARRAAVGLDDVPVPGWFHVAQGVLVLTLLLAVAAALDALVLARPGHCSPRP